MMDNELRVVKLGNTAEAFDRDMGGSALKTAETALRRSRDRRSPNRS